MIFSCPECNGKVSSEAPSCPHCGKPTGSSAQPPSQTSHEVVVKAPEKIVIERRGCLDLHPVIFWTAAIIGGTIFAAVMMQGLKR